MKKNIQCWTFNTHFCFFIFSHSTFDVGRWMFIFQNNLALIGSAPFKCAEHTGKWSKFFNEGFPKFGITYIAVLRAGLLLRSFLWDRAATFVQAMVFLFLFLPGCGLRDGRAAPVLREAAGFL